MELRANPDPQGPVEILIDRDLSLSTGPGALVATFASPILIYRAIDGGELSIVHELGRFEGGMFANVYERRWGASWAASSVEQVAKWARGWAERGRLDKQIFVVAADGNGHIFFREGGAREVNLDPEGPEIQPAVMDSNLCNTGLGCSIVVNLTDVTVYKISRTGTARKMSSTDIDRYVAKHPVPEVLLRNFGFGTPWFSGMILGQGVIIGQDDQDKLWNVDNREGRPVVLGARTKAAAIEATKHAIKNGQFFRSEPTRLYRAPEGFEQVEEGQLWSSRRGFRRRGTVERLGASYVVLRQQDGGERWTIKAPELMTKWEQVD